MCYLLHLSQSSEIQVELSTSETGSTASVVDSCVLFSYSMIVEVESNSDLFEISKGIKVGLRYAT